MPEDRVLIDESELQRRLVAASTDNLLDLPGPARLGEAVRLLMSLVDDGTLQGWNLIYPRGRD